MLTSLTRLSCFLAALAAAVPAQAQPFNILNRMIQAQESIVRIHSINPVTSSPSHAGIVDGNPPALRILRLSPLGFYERTGAGVVIDRSGVIVTNAHIIVNAHRIQIDLDNGDTFPAQVITVLNNTDIALLKVQTPYPLRAVAIADSNKIKLGQEVFTVGSSDLLDKTISGGKIIGIGVDQTLEQAGVRQTQLIQTTVNLYKGDSGGPLFDSHGRLIGIMTADEAARDHSSFAIPANIIKKFLLEYLATVTTQSIDPS